MKILFPIGAFYPAQSGGPNNTIAWITEALTNNNIDVFIVTTDLDILSNHKIIFNKWISSELGKIIYCKTLVHYLPFKLIYESVCKFKHVDIIHLTGVFYPPSLILYLINKIFFKKKIVWSPRGELAEEALIYSSFIKKIYLFIINFFINDKFFFHTTSKEETFITKERFNHNRIIQIPNYLKPTKSVKRSSKKSYLLFIGRISPKKAIENLIEALNISKFFKEKEMKLIIAGNYHNKYGDSLKKLCLKLCLDKNIDFIGHVEGKQKDILYANAFFTIMPSHNENFGNVVVESLSQSTPVIASTGTPWEILEVNNAGYWISNEPKVIAEKIDYVLCMTNNKYLSMRANSYKLMNEDFNIKHNIKNWIKFYNTLNK